MVRRRDKKRADHIMEVIEDLQASGEGLYIRWLYDDELAWEVRFVRNEKVFTGTHGSLEIALEWAHEQAWFHDNAERERAAREVKGG